MIRVEQDAYGLAGPGVVIPAEERPVTDPAGTMRRAADRLRYPYRCNTDTRIDQTLADWLDDAANEADEIGPNHRAERVAAGILGLPDPWPAAKPPARPVPEAVVTHVEGVPQ